MSQKLKRYTFEVTFNIDIDGLSEEEATEKLNDILDSEDIFANVATLSQIIDEEAV